MLKPTPANFDELDLQAQKEFETFLVKISVSHTFDSYVFLLKKRLQPVFRETRTGEMKYVINDQ